MAQQIKKKFIGADQVDGSKIKLLNGQSLRGINSQGQEVDLLKLSSQNKIQVLGQEVSLKSELQQEILDRQSGDSSTLVSAKSYADSQVSSEASLRSAADAVLDSKILAEKARIDAILDSSQADKDTFAEIVQLINSVDTQNDSAFASYVLSNNQAVAELQSDLSTEAARALSAEQQLASDLSAEISRATFAEQEIALDLSSESQRALLAEQQLASDLSAEVVRAMAAEQQLSSDLQSEVSRAQSAEQSLQSKIDAEKTRAMGVESSLQSQISQEISDRMADVSAEETRAMGVEASLQTRITQEVSNRTAAVQLLGQSVQDEQSARIAADVVLDGKIKTEKDRIDAILLASQSDKDSFAEIVQLINSVDTQNDSAFGSYVVSNNAAVSSLSSRLDVAEPKITTLQSGLASEISARTSADSSLQTQITALRDFRYEQIVHVAKNGLDTNNGRQHSPFLTITAALNSITDASPTKRYVVYVTAGSYTETKIELKPNVFIVGSGMFPVRITGPVTLHSSFTGTDDHRSGFSQCTLLSSVDLNWSTVTSQAGKIYLRDVQCLSSFSMYGHNNAIAQSLISNCLFVGNVTISGINVAVFNNNICFSNIVLNQHPNGGMVTFFSATAGYCVGTITLNATTNDFNKRISASLRGFPSEQLVLNGPAAYCDADLVSQGKSVPTISNGATLAAINPNINHDITMKKITSEVITPKATNAHNMGDWGKQWQWNFGNVHASTGTDLWLVSYPASYAPDSSGKWVCINADGAGLQNNVDGGSIELVTAQTTGTGVRGKVILDGKEIDVTSKQVKNLANGTASSDAVNKSQLDAVAGQIPRFEKGMVEVGSQLAYVDLDRQYSKILSASVDRMAIHEGLDYTLSVVNGKTRMTFINSLANPSGSEKIESGDKVFFSGVY